ncbi:S8 family peptidase [Paractinoplanes globisporus]|uniref:S8 family serine peptidase n=1 Tax=Paractinoplanes globisporus TaxID=113565 RepID=A0ABW6WV63_9ACTN|nr:S8 family serine peptidase [Actinoplanes globisporus]
MRIIDSEEPQEHFSDDTLLFFPSPSKPVGHFNDLLHAHHHVRPLGTPVHISGAVHVVPIVDGSAAEEVLGRLAALHEDAQFAREPAFADGTLVMVASKPVGHAGLAFAEIDPPAKLPSREFPAPPAPLRRPVVALLDTGVQTTHTWLPDTVPGDPFLIDAEQLTPAWEPDEVTGRFVVHREEPAVPLVGHATFIAGLIRQGAPTAQVLSVRVMNENGRANEGKVCKALRWLLGYIERGNPVDVVCMAFGRVPGDHSDQRLLDEMKWLLGELAGQGVQLVASAGNDHQDSPIYPAAFDTVTAVGAGFGHYHADFSNYGDWVDRYRDGVDVFSILPGEKWARWTGTSFAAANFAADMARPHVVP